MRSVWQLLAVVGIGIIGGNVVASVEGAPWLTFAFGAVTAALSVLVYAWVVRRTERRTVAEVAPGGVVPQTALGTVIGFGLFAMVVLNLFFLGFYTVEGVGSVVGAAGLVGFMAAAAATEEVLFRGVLYRIVEEKAGSWISLGLTSLLFGLWHLPNANATGIGLVAAGVAGAMIAAAYAATRNLWLPIGIHFGWNFAAAGVFSTEVSGNGATSGLLDAELSGPALITGGGFGPEGSPYSLAFCLLTMLVFLWIAHRRGRLVPFRRTERPATGATLPR
ncbi:CPBP family intramembrane glutamic endopeptidase [Streptomonospora salina]|uniref:Membrane protease YdiL (CAAX protease family) n=1 Tax=Streptomonospora salina TaxID=104205 RepID=A0A841E5X6_9ACTN|nr:type II CAAX endopeptidase family protein [Streptomonospora salina]MBB5996709.1 membrane protease YdiL (CAAX protease family) [Streptomonospora salina]